MSDSKNVRTPRIFFSTTELHNVSDEVRRIERAVKSIVEELLERDAEEFRKQAGVGKDG